MMMWGYGYDGYGWSMLWMVFWNIFWLVLLGLLILGIIRWLFGQPFRSTGRNPGSAPRSALDILQERYARGEIDEATFERMHDRLMTSSGQPRPTGPGQMSSH